MPWDDVPRDGVEKKNTTTSEEAHLVMNILVDKNEENLSLKIAELARKANKDVVTARIKGNRISFVTVYFAHDGVLPEDTEYYELPHQTYIISLHEYPGFYFRIFRTKGPGTDHETVEEDLGKVNIDLYMHRDELDVNTSGYVGPQEFVDKFMTAMDKVFKVICRNVSQFAEDGVSARR